MIEEMKKSREIVIKEIMMKVVTNKISMDEGLKQIEMFNFEAKNALEIIMKYEKICYQFTGTKTIT